MLTYWRFVPTLFCQKDDHQTITQKYSYIGDEIIANTPYSNNISVLVSALLSSLSPGENRIHVCRKAHVQKIV